MTVSRTKFIEEYAAGRRIDVKWAPLGFVEIGHKIRIALPCGCEQETCKGWTMVSAENVLDYLELYAPKRLRETYLSCAEEKGGNG